MTDAIIFEQILPVTCSDEYVTPADGALVKLERAAIERILELADVAEKHRIGMVSESSCDAEWGFIDEDGETFIDTEEAGDRNEDGPMRADNNCLELYTYGDKSYVHWTAYWKYTNVKLSTESVRVEALRDALRGPDHA